MLLATMAPDGSLDMRYQHVNASRGSGTFGDETRRASIVEEIAG